MRNQIFKLIILSILTAAYSGCSSKSNDCEPITCLNEGVFIDCACECPQGYTGVDCSTQVTPKKIIITKAIVKVFPNTNNGEFWDPGIPTVEDALPDIYITFQDSDLNTIYDSPTFHENVLSDAVTFFEFSLSPELELTNFDKPFLVNIWDYDTTSDDDFMTSYGFFAYKSTNNFPDVITVVSQTEEILVDLEVGYEW